MSFQPLKEDALAPTRHGYLDRKSELFYDNILSYAFHGRAGMSVKTHTEREKLLPTKPEMLCSLSNWKDYITGIKSVTLFHINFVFLR